MKTEPYAAALLLREFNLGDNIARPKNFKTYYVSPEICFFDAHGVTYRLAANGESEMMLGVVNADYTVEIHTMRFNKLLNGATIAYRIACKIRGDLIDYDKYIPHYSVTRGPESCACRGMEGGG